MRPVKFTLCFFFLVFCSIPVFAQQQKIDSLTTVLKTGKEDTNKVNNLNALCRIYYRKGAYDKADSIADYCLTLTQKLNFKTGLATAYSCKGLICFYRANYINALKFQTQSLNLDKEIGNKKGEAAAYGNIGNIYWAQGNYPEALKYQLQSLDIDEAIGEKNGTARAYGNLGLIYFYQGNYDEAIKYLTRAIKINEGLGDKYNLANNYGNLGNVYYGQHNYAEALKNHFKAFALDSVLSNNLGMLTDYLNIANSYSFLGDYNGALVNYFKTLKAAKQIGSRQTLTNAYENIGGNLLRQKKYTEAGKYLDTALSLATQMGDKDLLMYIYNKLSNLDTCKSNYKNAYYHYVKYVIYRDSLNNKENTRKLVSEQMQYDFDKKDAAAKAEQDKKDAIASADKKKQAIITGFIGFGLLLVLVFSGLLFSRFRVTQRQKKLIERQKALVEEKNKEVLDSITYAKRLQDALLPPLNLIKQYLPESFVLYKPKDIVAGDFYWMEKVGNAVLIAACDCTGHGVPGALVSVVCSNALNRTIKEFKIHDTGKVLDKVRELVLETFEKSESNVQDGMDISLASLTPSEEGIKVQWSGAFNTLLYMQEGEMKELPADKQPIGKTDNPKPFTTHTITFTPNTGLLYLFTDGYADQFGGPKGKKFKYKTLSDKLKAISDKPMAEQKQILEQTIQDWKGDLEQVDDILIIGIRLP
ncbi:MAG TPA: tetratricopeptide repeat protein [Bacteroidia bacterium]|nr:tetratricopeptide repeat protein [Bacteroidia bacterium]